MSSSAAVAELRQTSLLLHLSLSDSVSTSFLPVSMKAVSLLSSFFVLGPVVIHPERRASETSLISSSVISGGENGMTLFSILFLLDFYF